MPRPFGLRKLLLAAALLPCLPCRAAAGADEPMLQLTLGGRTLRGLPLAWQAERALLLQPDGRIISFAATEAAAVRRSENVFRAVDSRQMRRLLLQELGPSFEVSAAGHYVVAHAAGSRRAWAREFDQLHRSFLHYFVSRGVPTAKPRFPLVAIVFPARDQLLRYARQDGARLPPGCAGYYSNFTNRVAQYDQGGVANQSLIIHEAAHQVAFNTGVHHRGSPPPRWLSEGLGTMFEAPGVWNSSVHRDRKDRVNRQQLAAFRRCLPRRPAGWLPQFVSSSRAFSRDIEAAYAEAWALSFFLSETDPRGWAEYLRITSDIRRPATVSGPRRLGEFTAAFGPDLPMLEARFLRFIAELPQ